MSPYTCMDCGREYRTELGLAGHLCSKARVFACETCHDTGEIEVMTNRLGPDDYAETIACPDCGFPKDEGYGVPSA